MTAVAGALGIIMLDTNFERPPGDVGNPLSWPFPVLFETVRGATARAVVDGRDGALLDAFASAGEALRMRGARALVTSCGFLILRQRALASRVPLPLATSSLLQIPQVQALLPTGRTVGVVTYDAASLTPAHFAEAGVRDLPPVAGLPKGGVFHGVIEGGKPYDHAALRAELLDVIDDLIGRSPRIGAIVLECTNLPPFTRSIVDRFGLPVFDVLSLGNWLYASVATSPRTQS